ATWARARCVVKRPPVRCASSSTTIWPTLCRLFAYPGPGLPRPTTSQGAFVTPTSGGLGPSVRTATPYAGRPAPGTGPGVRTPGCGGSGLLGLGLLRGRGLGRRLGGLGLGLGLDLRQHDA